MQTIKTGVVIALLLAVCYGAFVALNAPEPELPASIEEWASGDDDFEQLVGFEADMLSLESAVPISGDQLLSQAGNASVLPGSGTDSSTPSLPDVTMGAPSVETPPAGGTQLPQFPLPNMPTSSASETTPPSGGLSNVQQPSGSLASATVGADIPSFPALDSELATAQPSTTLPSNTLGVQPVGNRTAIDNGLPGTGESLANDPLIPPLLNGNSPSNSDTRNQLPAADFPTARTEALAKAQSGELREALAMLSPYFGSPEISYEQNSDLVDILDALTREVIYSDRHLVEPAYTVSAGDSVASVAAKYSITPEFLNAINGLGNSKALVAGTKIKVLQGPFRARVSISQEELTLFLGDLYAGRFPISVGQDPTPRPGAFEVVDRQKERTYYGAGAVVLPASDPRNPYGGYWINLGDDLCIHGTAEMPSTQLSQAGCISLAPLDAKDVFNILVKDSRVEITQ